jgi:hypothetical protein
VIGQGGTTGGLAQSTFAGEDDDLRIAFLSEEIHEPFHHYPPVILIEYLVPNFYAVICPLLITTLSLYFEVT